MKIFFKALIATLALSACDPLKVTDARDPRFNPNNFTFSDYGSERELLNVLSVLFPAGTERASVEKVVIDIAGFQAGFTEGAGGRYFITYYDPRNHELPSYLESRILGNGLRRTQFEYDVHDRVVAIKADILDGKSNPKFLVGKPVGKGKKL